MHKSPENVFRPEIVSGKARRRPVPPDSPCSVCGKTLAEHTPQMHKECAKKFKEKP